MEISVRVCDVCQDPSRPVTRYTVLVEDERRERKGQTDRCDEHNEELERVVRGANAPVPRARPSAKTFGSESVSQGRRSGGSSRRVVSMDQIEASKRQR